MPGCSITQSRVQSAMYGILLPTDTSEYIIIVFKIQVVHSEDTNISDLTMKHSSRSLYTIQKSTAAISFWILSHSPKVITL